jgi:type IV secretory pathway VirD2 relaxase
LSIVPNMAWDETSRFRPRAGRIRDRGVRSSEWPRSFFDQVMTVVAKERGGRLPSSLLGCGRRSRSVGKRPMKGRCCRIGRGQATADRLKRAMRQSARTRRVVVKARIVRLKFSSRAADAHIRYLQRDGTTRDGERGRLYAAETDAADGDTFIKRGREDRHQFRFIIAPEDGDRLSDLRTFTRDVMRQMEEDLGTRLDWVAVDHFNTGHPHSHVVVRGRDDLGRDLIIAQDYITDGMRQRAQERATLELGPETDLELRAKLEAEISAERFTRIDRAMIAESDEGVLDVRPETGRVQANFDRTTRIRRLQTLERYGLATQSEPGRWTLSERVEAVMRELGERNDIVKTINRALADRGEERTPGSFVLRGEEAQTPIIGRVIDKRLTDELGDRIGLIIDGIDGRVHHVAFRDPAATEEAKIGAIVEVSRTPSQRPADRNIAIVATGTGVYRPSDHRKMLEATSARVREGDYEAFVDTHVRRLEALRRAGIVERASGDCWLIPEDFEVRARAYDAGRARTTSIRVLSGCDLDQQVSSDGATWLDRRLVGRDKSPLAMSGFGVEVREALDRRADELVRRGHASRTIDGACRPRTNLIATLQQQEVERAGRELAAQRGLAFAPVQEGQTVRGKLLGSTQLASGRFAMIDNRLGFSLVPWRPVLENRIGREVTGVVRGEDVSWQFGRARTLGIGI